MNVRFHTNPDGEPHVHDHGVSEVEVYEALAAPLEQVRGRDESLVLIGRTLAGRVLKIIFVDAREGDGIFVITAYDLPPKQLRALRRRLKGRGR
jgi:uncharacterized protein